MKYSAEYVRKQVGGDYHLTVKVFGLVATVYPSVKEAPRKAWERAIRLVNKTHKKEVIV